MNEQSIVLRLDDGAPCKVTGALRVCLRHSRAVDLIGLKAQKHLSLGQRPRFGMRGMRTLKAYFTWRNVLERNELRNGCLTAVPSALSVLSRVDIILGRCPRLRCCWAFSPGNCKNRNHTEI